MGSYAEAHGVPDHATLLASFEAARSRVASAAHRTPVLRSSTLDTRLAAYVHLKCENLQRMGAFKFRGAWNLVSQLGAVERTRGVVAYSSGNHAQAVALVARTLGIPAVIVMPSSAPAPKLAATRAYGAEVMLYDLLGVSREGLAEQVARDRGMTLVPPFDHPDIVVGQATAAAELFEETGPLDVLLVPVGGAGLLSGCALAAAVLQPRCRVVGVEPAGGDDAVRSFHSGHLQAIEHADTIADGARTLSLSPLTFALAQRYVHDIVSVPDAALIETMRFVWERLKLVVEPTGVLGLAAAMTGVVPVRGSRVGVVISGGNVDLGAACAWLAPRDVPLR
ncbi:MAG: threo-3-hydroxy-L-aspartate ammonia-lyase [Candidatus Eisenbacteria bacterium]